MNETSIIRPWQPAQPAASTPRAQAPARAEVDERLLMARLFGQGAPQTTPARPVPPRGSDDDFAPNLGRHVDVIA